MRAIGYTQYVHQVRSSWTQAPSPSCSTAAKYLTRQHAVLPRRLWRVMAATWPFPPTQMAPQPLAPPRQAASGSLIPCHREHQKMSSCRLSPAAPAAGCQHSRLRSIGTVYRLGGSGGVWWASTCRQNVARFLDTTHCGLMVFHTASPPIVDLRQSSCSPGLNMTSACRNRQALVADSKKIVITQ